MIAGDDDSLDNETRLAAEFVRAVLDDTAEQERLRTKLHTTVGERALVDISWAIATARLFPTPKRGLGYVVSCHAVSVQVQSAARGEQHDSDQRSV
ncbi:MAG: hypothetical protein AB7F89_06980 [Pirellulaceae bacterium]